METLDAAVQREVNKNDAKPKKAAAKKAKTAKKPKTAKPKTKKVAKQKAAKKARKVTKAKRKLPKKAAAKQAVVERSERLDMRLTKREKAKVLNKAKQTRRTVTSIVIEAIEKLK